MSLTYFIVLLEYTWTGFFEKPAAKWETEKTWRYIVLFLVLDKECLRDKKEIGSTSLKRENESGK